MPVSAPLTAASMSASAKTMLGDLPPSSSESRLSVPAASRMICLPISVEPVNAILSTRGSRTSAIPALPPGPVTTLKTPSGSPASWQSSANLSAVSGVSDAGFRTTVLPAASAGAIFQDERREGEERGVVGELGERERRERGERRGLQDDGVARGQRRGDLPGREEEGEVPGHDGPDHPDGLAEREGEGALAERERLAVDLGRPARVVAEDLRRERDLDLPRVEGLAGGGDGQVHVALVALGNSRALLLGGRIDGGVRLAGHRRTPVPSNEQLSRLHRRSPTRCSLSRFVVPVTHMGAPEMMTSTSLTRTDPSPRRVASTSSSISSVDPTFLMSRADTPQQSVSLRCTSADGVSAMMGASGRS